MVASLTFWFEKILPKINPFPISIFLLSEFVSGDIPERKCEEYQFWKNGELCSNIIYDTNHMISQQLRNSSDYKEYKKVVDSYKNDYQDLEVWEKVLVEKSNAWIFQSWDLYFAIHIHGYRWYLEMWEDEKLYSFIDVYDTYDFSQGTGEKTDLTLALIRIGEYFEKNMQGKPFEFIVQNREIID